MEVKLEAASTRMIDKLCEIEAQCFDQEAFTRRQILCLLSDHATIGLAAKSERGLAGFIITRVEFEDSLLFGHIITLNVAPSYRRRGIGTKMLNETEAILKGRGIDECHLEVREDNYAAIGLYQKSEYREIRRLEKYYGNKHGLYLKKTL